MAFDLQAFDAYMKQLYGGKTGYGSAGNVTPPSAYQNPYQLQSITGQAGAMADMYGADAAANASMYGANQAAGASMYGAGQNTEQARIQSEMQRNIATQQAGLGRDNNATAEQIANWQTGRSLEGQNRATDAGLNLGLDTNKTNQNIAGINVGPEYAKLDTLNKLLAGGSTALPGLGTTGASGPGMGPVGGSDGTTLTSAVPQFTPFSDVLLQQRNAKTAADLSRVNDSAQQNISNRLGQGGFSTTSPGAQSMFANMDRGTAGQIAGAQNDARYAQNQYNAQNALGYGTLGANQYNQAQDRALRLQLANIVGKQNVQQSLLSGLLG